MVNVLQKVTTFPIELSITSIEPICGISGEAANEYYINPTPGKGRLEETDLNIIKVLNNKIELEKYKKRFIVYNAIYDKLFENNLNQLEKIKQPTIIVFPTMDQSDKGQYELNSETIKYYDNKFRNIVTEIKFISNIVYIELKVFTNDSKEEYGKKIKLQFDDIAKKIRDYNNNITRQVQYRNSDRSKPIENILFLINSDKKGLFTGFYKRQLSKEKQDILNKEYSSFLSNSIFRPNPIQDNGMNITFRDVVNKAKYFQTVTGKAISSDIITSAQFDEFMKGLKELYKKSTDKEYKKSLELNDNVETLKIIYKIENADKVIEDKIQTGSNKLYRIYHDPNNSRMDVIGFFLLTSEERGIYRFKEDLSSFRIRKGQSVNTSINVNNNNKNKETQEEEENLKINDKSLYDFAVQIEYKYGAHRYIALDKKINEDKDDEIVRSGEAELIVDKTEGSYKLFNIRDIDASLLNKDVVKYYSDILFDKKTLIEYLKSKQKYNDKTSLSYEFLKINDSSELSQYCDFIYKNYKSNIIDKDSINPFKINFNKNTIIKNILDIVFESNSPIYLRASKQTKEEKRTSTNDSYKIVEYTVQDKDILQKDDSCIKKSKKDTNKCQLLYHAELAKIAIQKSKKKNETSLRIINLIVTKVNIKDIGKLKSATTCKLKKTKIIYDYKELFANITRRFGSGLFGGYKSKSKSRKRRLKAKRYK